MLKGNRDQYSAESINEVIAAKLHEMQGFDAHAEYRLIRIHGREYDYGSFSKLFTSQKEELITAYDVVMSKKQLNHVSSFEHFIRSARRLFMTAVNACLFRIVFQRMTKNCSVSERRVQKKWINFSICIDE